MNKSLYPYSFRDRLVFWLSVLVILAALFGLSIGGDKWEVFIGIVLGIGGFSATYFLRDKEEVVASSDEYTKVISQVAQMVVQLNELNKFFVREQQRIKDTEATVLKLHDERSKLEPVVQTQRETIEAILSAHANRTAKLVWKERLIGFGSGILTSILASVIYDFIQR